MFRLFIFFLFPVSLFSQGTDSIPLSIAHPLLRSFEIAYENDLLTVPINGRTDYYYTGGSFIGFNLPALQKNPVSKVLVKLPNGYDESFGITISNLGFSPTSIKSDSILYGDRPFCGTLFLGLNRVSCNNVKRIRLSSKLDLGVIGPSALGYETQKFIHAHTNNPEPHGWQFQIANDVYVNYSLKLEKGLLAKKNAIELIGYGIANAGTIYTNAGMGLLLRTGRMDDYFTSRRASDRLQAWAYFSGEAKVIGHDATLQGGLFDNKSVYVIPPSDVRRAVFSTSAGIVLAYKKVRVEWFNTFLTPEFRDGKSHGWGHLGLEFFF
ncbi:MAG: lipid A deacylase LpxR family protein [Bacteroidota bacterium]|nr:lipid A deacylase LpxR family protein [Bacteroidota bacterium]